MKQTSARKLIGIVCLAVVAITFGIVGLLDLADPFNDAAFDKVTWVAGHRDARIEMARQAVGLISSGMHKDKVVGWLGLPDEIYATNERARHFGERLPSNADQTYVYWLGGSMRTSLRGLDSAFLYVHLESDEVILAEIGGG